MVLPELRAEVESLVTALGPSTLTPDDPFAEVADAAGIIAGSLTYGADVMARAPNLKVIARAGIGVDGVDLRAATERGVAVCNVPDGPTVSTAEHAIALIGAVTKNVLKSGASYAGGRPICTPATALSSSTRRCLVSWDAVASPGASPALGSPSE